MESKELQEIKARAERIKKLLGNGSDALHLIEDDLPELVAEVEGLKTELGQAGNCPHGGLYKDRNCVECFGDGTEEMREALERSGLCPHERLYEDRNCVECFGDGTEEMRECSECGIQTWHRGGKCLRHAASAPKPYELLEVELKKLQGEIQTVQEQSSARVARAEERVKEIGAEAEQLREALERSGLCPHERLYEDRNCVECFGDGTEEMRE